MTSAMCICRALFTCIFFLTVVTAAPSLSLDHHIADRLVGLRPRGNVLAADKFKTPQAGPGEKRLTRTKCSGLEGFKCENRCKCKADGTLKCNTKNAQEMSYIKLPSQALLSKEQVWGDKHPDVVGICSSMCLCKNGSGDWAFAGRAKSLEQIPHENIGLDKEGSEGHKDLGHLVSGASDDHKIDIHPAAGIHADGTHPHTPSKAAVDSATSGAAGPSNLFSPHPHRLGADRPSSFAEDFYSSGAGPPSPHSPHSDHSGAGPSNRPPRLPERSRLGHPGAFAEAFYNAGTGPSNAFSKNPDSSGAGPSNPSPRQPDGSSGGHPGALTGDSYKNGAGSFGPSPQYSDNSGAGPSNPSPRHAGSSGAIPSDYFAQHFYKSNGDSSGPPPNSPVASQSGSFAEDFYKSGTGPFDLSPRHPDNSGAGPSNPSSRFSEIEPFPLPLPNVLSDRWEGSPRP